MISFKAFSDELVKLASGTYKSFFTGEERKDATFFPPGVMTQSSKKIFEVGKNPTYAPDGAVSSIRWLSYYLNRGGKNISPEQRKRIERARDMLSRYHKKQKTTAKKEDLNGHDRRV